MTTDRFERVLPGLFDEIADARTPDYLEAAIERASSHPQRPAWTFPERWLPMEITSTEVPLARPPWRALAILALLGILIAGAVAVYVGARPGTPPAPPFGLAENGPIAFAREGDIVAVDPTTGATTDLVVGAGEVSRPVYSPDGRHIAFIRESTDMASGSDVLVVAAEGGDPVVISRSRSARSPISTSRRPVTGS